MYKGVKKPDQLRVSEIIDQVKEILDRNLNNQEYRLYLYGSRAKGAATAHADIDLAVASPYLDEQIFRRIKAETDALRILYSIDLIDLREVERGFRELVIKTGQRLN